MFSVCYKLEGNLDNETVNLVFEENIKLLGFPIPCPMKVCINRRYLQIISEDTSIHAKYPDKILY